jgi:hypothetical protein
VGTELLKVDITDLPDENDYEVVLLYEPSTYFAFAGGAKVERVLKDIDQAVEEVIRFFAIEPALLRRKRPEAESPEERKEVMLQSLLARLAVIRERLEIMGKGLGVEMPDPYRPLRAYFKDLETLWRTEFRPGISDSGIVELVESVFACRSDLEERGLIEHDIQGLPALERIEPYPELVTRLELAIGLLEQAIKQQLGVGARLQRAGESQD